LLTINSDIELHEPTEPQLTPMPFPQEGATTTQKAVLQQACEGDTVSNDIQQQLP